MGTFSHTTIHADLRSPMLRSEDSSAWFGSVADKLSVFKQSIAVRTAQRINDIEVNGKRKGLTALRTFGSNRIF